ncbi:ankyrin repeat domain-containing protein [Aspergillus thermomutatus]|uniref:F-box domain-containing protein n=1 Tax=Aspergillus thermomutatus TaxID=41047 RepID=A0A397GFW1_ASPTH|nr:uncharacterized protein CDV56_105812 [Aspergillus thermomutatus]RHZ47893.1 hypothetical protein CDV56_105812 [Aspergillus thermomutatus]
MSLLNLPLELLYEIASYLESDRDLNALVRTCSPLYTVFNFELYRRDTNRDQDRALFWAIQHDRPKTLWKSLEAGELALWPTLLSLAAEHDSVTVMKALVQDGLDIKAVEELEGVSLLCLAVVNRSPKVLRYLLTRKDVDPNWKDVEGQTPLAYAASKCFNDLVKILLKSPRVDVNSTDNGGCTPLHLAAGKAHVYVVRTLLSDPWVDVGARDNVHHKTALLAAVEALGREIRGRSEKKVRLKHLRTIEALLDHPATSVNYATDHDLISLYLSSATCGYEGIFKLLWSKGVGPLPYKLDRPGILFEVAEHGQAGIMKMLLADGLEPDAREFTGRTSLSIAAEHKQIDVIRVLLSTGKVDINSKDLEGLTPLWWAMTHGWKKTGTDETVKLLIAHEATIPTIEEKPLLLKSLLKALENGDCFLSELLMDQLDQIKPMTSNTRQRLLSAVAKSRNVSLAETLLEKAGIDPNARNSKDRTVLDRAVRDGDMALLNLLLALDGIDLNSRAGNGDTALAIAMNELSAYFSDFPPTGGRQFYERCMAKLLQHKDVTTASLDSDRLIEFIIAYLSDGDQKLIKLLIAKDDRLVADAIVHEDGAETLLEWAQQNRHRAIVRMLIQKKRCMRRTN